MLNKQARIYLWLNKYNKLAFVLCGNNNIIAWPVLIIYTGIVWGWLGA